MCNRVRGSVLTAIAGLAFSGALFAQTQGKQVGTAALKPIPRSADGKPSLVGGWIRKNKPSVPSKIFTSEPLPMQPWASEKCKTIACGTDERGGPPEQSVDPVISRCAP